MLYRCLRIVHHGTMTENWTALGAAVKERRKALRMSQIELGEAAGASRSTVQTIERGDGYELSAGMLALIERGLYWTVGSVQSVLGGGEPTPAAQTPPPIDTPDPLNGLPASVLDELADGEVYATDIHDLSQDGGITLITVAVRRAGEPGEQVSAEQRRLNFRAWSRVQRQLNNLSPLEWEPGDPEEWRQHPEES